MSVAVERSAPAPGRAGISNRGTGRPRRVWPTATRAACSADGSTSGVGHAEGQADPLLDQPFVGLAGGLFQRLA